LFTVIYVCCRRTEDYLKGPSPMWDVGGDNYNVGGDNYEIFDGASIL
jgi:hypothetical protein